MSVTDPTAWATAMNNLGMVPVGLAGQQLVTGEISVRDLLHVSMDFFQSFCKHLESFLKTGVFL